MEGALGFLPDIEDKIPRSHLSSSRPSILVTSQPPASTKFEDIQSLALHISLFVKAEYLKYPEYPSEEMQFMQGFDCAIPKVLKLRN